MSRKTLILIWQPPPISRQKPHFALPPSFLPPISINFEQVGPPFIKGGLWLTTAVDPRHLKVKEDISLTKNYCITISIQKITFIHKFIL